MRKTEVVNSVLIAINIICTILALASTILSISLSRSGIQTALSLIILALYIGFLFISYKKYKAKTGKGIYLAIVGLFLFWFVNFFTCLGIPWYLY